MLRSDTRGQTGGGDTAGDGVKGLDLAEDYYREHGCAMIARHFPGYERRIAAGLVGEGSPCYGFDDELSQDHDWGPGFCLWLTAQDYAEVGEELQKRYDDLPSPCRGFERPVEGPYIGKRTGVFEVTDFYSRFIRYDHVPSHPCRVALAAGDLPGHGDERPRVRRSPG